MPRKQIGYHEFLLPCKKFPAYTYSSIVSVTRGVTGQSIPPAGLYPGLKWPRLDYTRVYYGLG